MPGIIRVLIVDDSPLARSVLRDMFDGDATFQVVAEAENGRQAVAFNAVHRPDLITMDLEMPEMTGMEAIAEIMANRPAPILVVSSFADAANAFAAVSRGAVDVTSKPELDQASISRFLEKARLVASIPVIRHIRTLVSPLPAPPSRTAPAGTVPDTARLSSKIVAIAASTGGPQALAKILGDLPSTVPFALIIAQHIVPGFAAGLAQWLSTVSRLPVKLAEQGQVVRPGTVYLSPSEAHTTVGVAGRLTLTATIESDRYRPSCNRLLSSVAAAYGKQAVGIILTGMGNDGAEGLSDIAKAGGLTIAQDEASSVVFGMNRVAIEKGAVTKILPIDAIAREMTRVREERPK
jgi:two-component system chemotaxis response regulator CheB